VYSSSQREGEVGGRGKYSGETLGKKGKGNGKVQSQPEGKKLVHLSGILLI